MLRLSLLALLLSAAVAHAEMPVGLTAIHIADPDRPLDGLVWYPAQPGGGAAPVGETRVWVGSAAIRNAAPAPGRFPLVLLSHGMGGHDLNQGWLAVHLASEGMVVAAVNHPHSTSGDVSPAGAMAIWHRPADLSRTIDWLEADPVLAPHLDRGRVVVIGHSLGGYTALALAGVRLDRDRVPPYCAAHQDEGCPDMRRADVSALPAERFNPAARDARVTAVVAMAPGLTQAMTADSLRGVAVPVLVLAGALDQTVRVAHVRAMVARLPAGAVYAELPQAGHYDFLPVCQRGGAALLRAVGEEEPVCDGAADRAAVHAAIEGRIDRFLVAGK